MQLAEDFPIEANIRLIVASPMRRAIYTAIETFRTFLPDDHGRDIIALPLLQETTDFRCDIGSPSKDLQAEVEGSKLPVDLKSLVGENWIVKVRPHIKPSGLTDADIHERSQANTNQHLASLEIVSRKLGAG